MVHRWQLDDTVPARGVVVWAPRTPGVFSALLCVFEDGDLTTDHEAGAINIYAHGLQVAARLD